MSDGGFVALRNAVVRVALGLAFAASLIAAAFSPADALGLVLAGLLSIAVFLFGARAVRLALARGSVAPLLASHGLRMAVFAGGLALAAASDRVGLWGFAAGLFCPQAAVYLVELFPRPGEGARRAEGGAGVG